MKNKAEAAEKPVVDLSVLDTTTASDKGARIELNHPTTGTGLGIYVTVLGKHSTVFRDIVRERVNKRVHKESMAARRGKHLDPRTAEEVEREALELLVACTLGWDSGEDDPTLTFKGEKLPFNAANALNVYSELLWVREQVDNAIGDLENFISA